jgi:hypothetical protein
MDGCLFRLVEQRQWASAPAFLEHRTLVAFFWDVSAFAKPEGKIMVPNLIPRILKQIAYGLVERLAWDHITVGFDAHIVASSGAPFDSKLHLDRIEMAVLGWCIPD